MLPGRWHAAALLPLFLLLVAAPVRAADRCTALVGSCEYYDCVEQERLSCGADGYAVSYAGRFCRAFSQAKFLPTAPGVIGELYPANGNAWRDRVRHCLQERMEAHFDQDGVTTCQDLRSFGFSTHPACYTEGPDSFCDLGPDVLVQILTIIGPNILLTEESQKQVFDTARICVAWNEQRSGAAKNPTIAQHLKGAAQAWDLLSKGDAAMLRLLKSSAERGARSGVRPAAQP